MKNHFYGRVIMVLLIAAVTAGIAFAASSRKQIDTFFADYEKLVVKAEKAAEKGDMLSYLSLQAESIKFAEKSDKLQNTKDWTEADSEKYLSLTNRYTAALLKLSGSMSGGY